MQMKFYFKILPAIFLFLSVVPISAQQTWSLQKCVDYAIENNIQIKQQELASDYQGNLVNQAKSDRLPNLNGQLGNNYNFGRSLQYDNTYEEE